MSSVRISPGTITGAVRAPGSKSYTQRYVLASAFTDASLHLSDVAFCEDDLTAISIAESCGKAVRKSGSDLWISGPYSCPESIDCRDSGTTLRLSLGLLSARGCVSTVNLSKQLSARPILPLLESLSGNGVIFDMSVGHITIDASAVRPGNSDIGGQITSQFVSSLLMFQALMDSDKSVRVLGHSVSGNYIVLTMQVMKEFGATVSGTSRTFDVSDTFSADRVDAVIEGDYSSAAYFLALGALTSQEGITIENLNPDSLQPDAAVFRGNWPGSWSESDDRYHISRNRIGKVVIDCDETPDLAPVTAVLGLLSGTGSTILHAERLRTKESDRLSEITRLVRAFGGEAVTKGMDLEVEPSNSIPRVEELSFTDHRMIMAAIVAGIASEQTVIHHNVELIAKSYPGFLTDLEKIGVHVESVQ